jgi:hypothetical protein
MKWSRTRKCSGVTLQDGDRTCIHSSFKSGHAWESAQLQYGQISGQRFYEFDVSGRVTIGIALNTFQFSGNWNLGGKGR